MQVASPDLVSRQTGSEFVVTIAKFFSDLGPSGRADYLYLQLFLFCLLISLSILSVFEKSISRFALFIKFNSNWCFSFVLFTFIVLSRLPNAIYGYQNPDEGVWIACAKALIHDPRLWISADTSTSGPLILAPLIVLHWLSIPIDFGSVKLISGFTLGFATMFTYLALNRLFGKSIARVTILPISIALAMTSYWDFISYNGEQVTLLLLSASLFLFSNILLSTSSRDTRYVLLGLLLGSIPFAKLQGVPMALLIAFAGFILLLKEKLNTKKLILFAVSGLVPTIVFLIWIAASGGLNHFWNSYISYNLFYAVSETPIGVSLVDKIILAWNMLFEASDLTPFFQLNLMICLFCILFINPLYLKTHRLKLLILVFSICYFVISLYCIGQSYRTFTHYTLLSAFSITLMLASFLCAFYLSYTNEVRSNGLPLEIVPVTLVVFLSILYFYSRFNFHPGYHILAETRKNEYQYMPEVIQCINKNSKSGDKIAVWGWSNTFYVDTDLIMGTRFTDTSGLFTKNPLQNYIHDVYMMDLQNNTPKIFLDAINPNAVKFFDRDQYGLDKFPTINAYILENYLLAAEIEGYRIYARK